jgi:hypothetical protein
MAKKTTSTPKTGKNIQIPVCPDTWKTIKTSNTQKKDLYIQWNKGETEAQSTFSIKVGGCGRRRKNNVGWIHNGNLSLKEPIYIYGQLEDIITEINKYLSENITRWACWTPSKNGENSQGAPVNYQGWLRFNRNAEALCFLSKFYRLHSCPENPAEITALIHNPC